MNKSIYSIVLASELYNEGIDFHKAGLLDDAYEKYEEAVAFNPNHDNAFVNMSVIDGDRGNIEKMNYYLDKALAINSHNPLALSNRGFDLRTDGKYEEAEEMFTKAINIDNHFAFAYIGRGVCYIKMNKPIEAEKDLLKGTRIRYPKNRPEELVSFTYSNQLNKRVWHYGNISNAGFLACCDGIVGEFAFTWPSIGNRIILDLQKLHISRTYKKLLKKEEDNYLLVYDFDINTTLDCIQEKYQEKNDILPIHRELFTYMNKDSSYPRAVGVALLKNDEPIAVDMGIEINCNKFNSRSGCYMISGAGTKQLILQATELRKKGFTHWCFGPFHSRYNKYKFDLGAEEKTTEQCIKLFQEGGD